MTTALGVVLAVVAALALADVVGRQLVCVVALIAGLLLIALAWWPSSRPPAGAVRR